MAVSFNVHAVEPAGTFTTVDLLVSPEAKVIVPVYVAVGVAQLKLKLKFPGVPPAGVPPVTVTVLVMVTGKRRVSVSVALHSCLPDPLKTLPALVHAVPALTTLPSCGGVTVAVFTTCAIAP
ncbi:hypothetical protein [Solilutibacter silvestris]|uniref:hypothetical protein n=1 Tax=Solilutibacter silvestris TaxID=1645665 RepID=UPI0013FD668E|nr:hypothetical protein [Lysobacter silvestris]